MILRHYEMAVTKNLNPRSRPQLTPDAPGNRLGLITIKISLSTGGIALTCQPIFPCGGFMNSRRKYRVRKKTLGGWYTIAATAN